jgi:crotonobetainyl-CoA:carnitine CoA-transferase CaiB-like acyl-CoA transferase
MVGGKILADLGADVIKIETPGGSASRRIGPFYKDIPDPERSLFWFAYNTNKRGITLDIDHQEGCELFCKLAKTADIVLESFDPGYLDGRGVGYEGLCEANPSIILTSITPFGQTGPKAHYKGSELTAWASGGALYAMGEPDRPPVWVSFPQAYLHGGTEAACGSVIALWHRSTTGEGQHVDVSIQQCVLWCLMNLTGHWECHQWNWPRDGMNWKGHQGTLKGVGGARCKDGYVAIVAWPVPVPPIAATFEAMKAMIIEEGKAPEWWLAEDWYAKYFELQETGDQELIDQPWKPIEEFLPSKTKAELYELALEKRLLIAPAQSVEEICKDPQLEAREYWQDVEHPELGDTITYCGAPIKLSEAPFKIGRRSPLIGEHNQEIYEKDLGLSREEVVRLREKGVI